MLSLETFTADQIGELQRLIVSEIEGCRTLQEAAQAWTSLLFRELGGAPALVRTYATFPFSEISRAYQTFASNVANAKGAGDWLLPRTPVLCLLGSAGVEPAWNDVYESKGHLAIPLINAGFVDEIPMVARLLNDMGIGLNWLNNTHTDVVVQTLGRISGHFYVRDAILETDHKHRIVVADQEFVEKYDIHTVFGIGGSYLTGTFITLVFFTREALSQEAVERFQSLIHTIKSETVGLTLAGQIFAT